jgi:hypothetical protein
MWRWRLILTAGLLIWREAAHEAKERCDERLADVEIQRSRATAAMSHTGSSNMMAAGPKRLMAIFPPAASRCLDCRVSNSRWVTV